MMKTGVVGGILAIAMIAVGAATTFAQDSATATAAPAPTREMSDFEKELMQPGPMPEMTMGDPSAPITVIEYASMTCGHCAHFAETSWPILKQEYIDTGKVYFIMREFPLDPLAAAGFMLARNAPGGRYFDVVESLFATQKDWAFTDKPVEGLRNISKQFGYSPQTFEETLKDQKLLDDINAVRARAADTFKVDSTPTFFINGEQVRGAMEPDAMREKLDGILAETAAAN